MNVPVSDWIIPANEDLKYRRIGNMMEVIVSRCFFERPEIHPIEFTTPKGYVGKEIDTPRVHLSYNEQTLFMGVVIPDHWILTTMRSFKIDGWENKVIMFDDAGEAK